jgi:hypothetical protein
MTQVRRSSANAKTHLCDLRREFMDFFPQLRAAFVSGSGAALSGMSCGPGSGLASAADSG